MTRVDTPGAAPDARSVDAVVAHFTAGRHEEAEAGARALTEAWPKSGVAWKILGTVLASRGRLEDALDALRKSAALSPADSEAHNNLGFTLQALSRPAEAEASFRRALELDASLAATHCNLGNALRELGRLEEAVDSYRRALGIDSRHAMAHSNLGAALTDLDRIEEAAASYAQAVAIDPGLAEAHGNLAAACSESGKAEEAVAHYRRAAQSSSGGARRAFELSAALVLPVIADSRDDIARWRRRFAEEVDALFLGLEAGGESGGSAPLLPRAPAFYLAYHDENDRGHMRALHRLMRRVYPEAALTAPHVGPWRGVPRGRRLRVGFVSEFLVDHTIGRLFQGFIRELDRRRFEVIVIHAPRSKQDPARERIDSWADRAVDLSGALGDQQRAIAAERLDLLFYPDIGMSPATYFLALARLAPVQATSFGHPDTTGIDAIDYFVSADAWEPADADAHYTERLIRLNRLPSCYRPEIPQRLASRAELGLPEQATLYGCPQSLFKFHPDFDAVLEAIVRGDPAGRVVLIESRKDAPLGRRLRERWTRSAPLALERTLFIPAQPHARFMALNAHMDVLLDPPHFGGGNTMYEAMVYGTPIVVWPGRFMRGRLAYGAYRQMAVPGVPVARDLEEFAALALSLGRDAPRRGDLRASLAAAAKRELFEDLSVVRELENFFEAAVHAAAQGTRLAEGWKPG